jgi:hypothetical protein
MSGIVSALTVFLLLLFVTPILRFLPSSALSAIIVVAVSRLVDVSGARQLWHVDKRDFVTMLAAFCATLVLGVLVGVIASMGFSLVLFLAFTTQPKVEELGRLEGTVIYRHVGMLGVTKVPELKLLRFLAPLFFANCRFAETPPDIVVIYPMLPSTVLLNVCLQCLEGSIYLGAWPTEATTSPLAVASHRPVYVQCQLHRLDCNAGGPC